MKRYLLFPGSIIDSELIIYIPTWMYRSHWINVFNSTYTLQEDKLPPVQCSIKIKEYTGRTTLPNQKFKKIVTW